MERSLVKAASAEGRIGVAHAAVPALAVIVSSLSSGGYGDLALGSGTVLVWLLLAGFVLLRRESRDPQPTFLAAGLALVALLGFTALSLGWASDDGSGFTDVVRVAGYLGAFLLAGLSIRRSGGAATLAGIAIGVAVVAAIALGARLSGLGGGEELAAQLPGAGGRLSYPIGYWNALGALMALGIPLLLWLRVEGSPPWAARAALAAAPLPLLAAYVTASRGALLAAALGAAAFAWRSRAPGKALGALALAGLGALPAATIATLRDGFLEGAGIAEPGPSELLVATALLAGVAAVWLLDPILDRGLARRSATRSGAGTVRRSPRAGVLLGLLALAAGALLVAGPGGLLEDFRAPPDERSREPGAGILSASGSGRSQFWRAALEAFADAPARGIGAGDYASYWNRAGSLPTPVRNAHSEPLELLAELGVVGCGFYLAFMAALFWGGIRATRERGSPHAAAALGMLSAAAVGFLIDWTWQVPAVVVPVLIAGAIVTSSPGEPRGVSARAGAITHARPRLAALAAGACIVLALPAIWAGGVLSVAAAQLSASESALERGQLAEAADAARAAAAIEPWASEPWLQLAQVERGGGNLQAAQRDVAAAIDRSPEDFVPWLYAGIIQAELGKIGPSIAYGRRALILAPLVLPRSATASGLTGLGNRP